MRCRQWISLQKNIMVELRRLSSTVHGASLTHFEVGQEDSLAVALRKLHEHEHEHGCNAITVETHPLEEALCACD